MSNAARPSHPTGFRLAHLAVESALRLIAYYLIPLGIGVCSLIALLFWNNHYSVSRDVALGLQVFNTSGLGSSAVKQHITPAVALTVLRKKPTVDGHDTHLSEDPVWFLFATRQSAGAAQGGVIELPSRHATRIACWNGATLEPLGTVSRTHAEGALQAVKAGFALRPAVLPAQVLCRANFVGPARLTVRQWESDEFDRGVHQYHRKSGLLDGGMIVLALFVLITAFIIRERLYLLFAGWLILNLRLGAISAGWDIQWLGQVVPPSWLLMSRTVTIALYGIATLTMYQALLRDQLGSTRSVQAMRVMQWLCLPMLAAAIFLPFRMFLPALWVIVVCCFSLMTIGLVKVIVVTPNSSATWFAASFAVTFLASVAEVVSAALGVREVVGVINSVTAALASSVLAALAVAEQIRMETHKRVEAQQTLQHAFEVIPVGLFSTDRSGNLLSANPAMLKMLGASAIVPGETAWREFFPESTWNELLAKVGGQKDVEMQLSSRDGAQRFMVSATLTGGRIEAVLQDITEKHRANEQLSFMANNDPLTKVYNRRGIEEAFVGASQQLAPGRALSLAYIDLDRFKLINDLFGHETGDEVLKQVCERMQLLLTASQKIGRVGGDEFVIVMPDLPLPLSSVVARGIVDRIGGTPYRVGDKAFHIRGSVGLIEVAPGMAMKDAISAADRACREAKDGHNNGLVVYERGSAAFQERESELTLVERLNGPNPTENMFLEMQPIMSLRTPHESLNFEVLLRMREPDGRVSPAGPLISAAEKHGRAGVIDRWVLSTTLAWIEEHIDALSRTHFVCMNLSGASLNDERFLHDTLGILEHYAHVAARLCIEVTESVALHDLDNTRRFIDQVRAFGVRVALDDFGAGYTSFSYLKELPADVVKIDGSFIVNINEHPANVAIVEAIVSLAGNLGMKTIAEWAEDADTVRTLAEVGVDYVQGYAIARSQPPEKLLAASSSASFIKCEEVLQLVRTLGASANEPQLGIAYRVH